MYKAGCSSSLLLSLTRNKFFLNKKISIIMSSNFCVGQSSNQSTERDWIKELEEAKIDIKYLADNLNEVPPVFRSGSPSRNMFIEEYNDNILPIIDMRLPEIELIKQIKRAASKFGYFQIVNHGVPQYICDDLLQKMRVFYDHPSYRKYLIGRDVIYDRGIHYNSTHDLPKGQIPTWHDTLYIRFKPSHCDFIPPFCITQLEGWRRETEYLAFRISRLLAKGLNLSPETFSQMMGRVGFFGNFYPRCRDRNVLGFQPHSDPCFFTILVQDDSGGLLGLYNGKGYEIKPIRGALVVFIGDLLEILTEGEYQSGVHWVKSSPSVRPRVSVAQTFSPYSAEQKIYMPFVTSERPSRLIKPVEMSKYVEEFYNSKLTVKTMVNLYLREVPRHLSEPSTKLCLGPPSERI